MPSCRLGFHYWLPIDSLWTSGKLRPCASVSHEEHGRMQYLFFHIALVYKMICVLVKGLAEYLAHWGHSINVSCDDN